jgi:hypothetical protein
MSWEDLVEKAEKLGYTALFNDGDGNGVLNNVKDWWFWENGNVEINGVKYKHRTYEQMYQLMEALKMTWGELKDKASALGYKMEITNYYNTKERKHVAVESLTKNDKIFFYSDGVVSYGPANCDYEENGRTPDKMWVMMIAME